jgi:hypothetical protein
LGRFLVSDIFMVNGSLTDLVAGGYITFTQVQQSILLRKLFAGGSQYLTFILVAVHTNDRRSSFG